MVSVNCVATCFADRGALARPTAGCRRAEDGTNATATADVSSSTDRAQQMPFVVAPEVIVVPAKPESRFA